MKWIKVEDRLPEKDTKVLTKATRKNYQFGHPQLLAGHFVIKYYDTPINEFKLTGLTGWTVVEWMDISELAR